MRTALNFEDVAAIRRRCEELVPGLEIVSSRDPRRAVLLAVMAGVHGVKPSVGWSMDNVRQRVSMAIPAMPFAGLLGALPPALASVPVLGGLGLALSKQFDHPVISTSPMAEGDPNELADVLCHETGHLLQAADKGFVGLCLKYVRAETRTLMVETPCYSTTLFWRKVTAGVDPALSADAIVQGLAAYGANPAQQTDARRLLEIHVQTIAEGLLPPVRTLIEAVRVLQARGIQGLPALPPPR